MSGGRSKVDIVITGTGTHHDLKILCSVKHLCVHFVRTYDESVDVSDSGKQVSLCSIFLQQDQFCAGILYDLTHTIHRNSGKRFFGSYKNFHVYAT